MTKATKAQIITRFKSLAWRLGNVVFFAVLDWSAQELQLANLSPEMVTILGLVSAEITKWANNKLSR